MRIRGGWRRTVAGIATAAVLGSGLATFQTLPAKAATRADTCDMIGQGRVLPGFGVVPQPESLSLVGTMTCVGTDTGGWGFSGTGSCVVGSAAECVGSLDLKTGFIGVELNCHLATVLTVWQFVCDPLSNPGGQSGAGHGVATPNDTLPETSFTYVGTVTFQSP